ncbi:MAG: NADPH-dependent F420 reductase [Anaerolineales bacterium]|nr:NADPH-dependent F420 reductase [Anaerolineales bacterium]
MSKDINKNLPTIAILGGTGKIGPGLAMRWAKAGFPIIIGSRQESKAQKTAESLKQKLDLENIVGMENKFAARKADICVLTVESSAHQSAIESLREDLQGKILVDTTARVDFRNPKPPSPPSAVRLAQQKLGEDVRVVAAFQNVPANVLKEDLDYPVDMDVLVCSDNIQAAATVVQLSRMAGVRAYYAGDLDNALVVEGLTALLIHLNKHYGGHTAIRVTGIDKD